jgi:hypothetical protein
MGFEIKLSVEIGIINLRFTSCLLVIEDLMYRNWLSALDQRRSTIRHGFVFDRPWTDLQLT